MTSEEWAYIAGLFDGEGCVYRRLRSGHSHRIQISQSTPEVLEWVRNCLGYGKIYGPYARNQYTWTLGQRKLIGHFARGVLPYSIVKRIALEDLLKVIQ